MTQSKEIDDLVNGPQDVVTPAKQNAQSSQTSQSNQTTQKTPTTPITQKSAEEKEKPQQTPHPQITTQPETTPDTTYTEPRKKVMKGYKVNGYRVQVYA